MKFTKFMFFVLFMRITSTICQASINGMPAKTYRGFSKILEDIKVCTFETTCQLSGSQEYEQRTRPDSRYECTGVEYSIRGRHGNHPENTCMDIIRSPTVNTADPGGLRDKILVCIQLKSPDNRNMKINSNQIRTSIS
jgi:hypothetical protein